MRKRQFTPLEPKVVSENWRKTKGGNKDVQSITGGGISSDLTQNSVYCKISLICGNNVKIKDKIVRVVWSSMHID